VTAVRGDAGARRVKASASRGTAILACLAGVCLVLAAAALLTGCAVTPPAGTVIIHDLEFDPPAVTVAKGATVTWVNRDQIPVQIQTDDYGATPPVPGQFSSEPLNPGESYSHTFADTGTFSYSDPFHPYIKGSVSVR
jgi:plastocyanin